MASNFNMINRQVNSTLNSAFSNVYVMSIVKIFLISYGASAAISPPAYIKDVFSNIYFKIFYIMLIIFIESKDFSLSLLLAIIFVMTMNSLSGRGPLEAMTNTNAYGPYSKDYKISTTAGILEPKTNIFNGCEKVTLAQLLDVFDGDHLKLQSTVKYVFNDLNSKISQSDKPAKERLAEIAAASGLPYNVELNDKNAPYIASLLINWGYKISDTCGMSSFQYSK